MGRYPCVPPDSPSGPRLTQRAPFGASGASRRGSAPSCLRLSIPLRYPNSFFILPCGQYEKCSGGRERTRTSTLLRTLPPQGSLSTSSSTRPHYLQTIAHYSLIFNLTSSNSLPPVRKSLAYQRQTTGRQKHSP